MKYLPFIGKLLLILLIAVIALLFSTAFFMQDKVSDIILASLNRNLSTRLEVESMQLSFLRKFPKGSVELKNVVVHSSPGFNTSDFGGINTDTLLFARSIFMKFRLADMLTGNYNIEEISARSGSASFLTDASGRVNYDVSAGESDGKDEFKLNLQKIDLAEMTASYINLSNRFRISGFINNGKLKSRISGKNVDFTAVTEMKIDSFKLFNTTITHPVEANLDLALKSTKEGITFSRSSLEIDNYDFSIEGTISSDDIYDLAIRGNDVDISKIRRYLPDKYLKLTSGYDPSGILVLTCSIKGPLTRKLGPHVEIDWQLDNGHIRYGKSRVAVENISFRGNFTNGSKNRGSTSTVTVNDLKVKLGSSDYNGSLLISNFDRPKTEIKIAGRVFPDEIREFFKIKYLTAAGGSVDADLKLATDFWPKDSITIDDIIDLKPEGSLDFNSFMLGWGKEGMLFRNVNGNLSVSGIYKASGLTFEYEKQKIGVNGEFRNVLEWLDGRPVTLAGYGDVYFNRLIPEAFTKAPLDENPSRKIKGTEFPGNVMLDLNFRIDSLSYKSFSSSDIKGNLTYKPRLLTFKSLDMKSLSGTVSGSGFIVQNANKSIMSRGDFNVSGIDVNKAFKTFNNFGQDFIVAGNLSGDLSGSISLLIPMDVYFKPKINAITAEGRYILVNGALINFEPVKQLSNFIELSELENINFQKLENDFFIRNNVMFIPQMDVKSSAADLTVNGQHGFDNNYVYHVKILLSQILSKKRKGKSRTVNEFGVVQDDGLGRTSILLRIGNNGGDDVKVGYDIKAVSQEVKNNIKTERQALKTLLNEEYGWYEDETKPTKAPAEKKNRFSITWEETDSIPAAKEPVENEEGGFKSLFRKK